MNPACGFTGCGNPVVSKCAKCSLLLCAEHAAEVQTDAGSVVCCRRCAAYLQARAPRGEARKEVGEGGC